MGVRETLPRGSVNKNIAPREQSEMCIYLICLKTRTAFMSPWITPTVVYIQQQKHNGISLRPM